jgi:hypothetical protein
VFVIGSGREVAQKMRMVQTLALLLYTINRSMLSSLLPFILTNKTSGSGPAWRTVAGEAVDDVHARPSMGTRVP